MYIINMTQLNKTQIIQAAQILTDSIPIGWPTLQSALDEINELLTPENTLLAAVENDIVIGWGGILPEYNGNVFEIHPLAVRSDKRRQGIGGTIITALENEARKLGGLTIHVGADDEKDDGETSFANVDLYVVIRMNEANFAVPFIYICNNSLISKFPIIRSIISDLWKP